MSLNEALNLFSPPVKRMSYGTAGFRDEWKKLHAIFVRMGILATLRSRVKNGQCVGVMITASHNAEKDNGIKVVDIDGGMLSQDWEPFAESIANFQTTDEVLNFITELTTQCGNDLAEKGTVIVGRDTRPHSKELFDCLVLGINGMNANYFDLGEVTTPQLHFVVQHANEKINNGASVESFNSQQALQEYYTTLSRGLSQLQESSPNDRLTKIVVDGAYGVGGLAISSLVETFNTHMTSLNPLVVDLRNKVREGPVNDGCGAEVVQKGQVPPCGVSSVDDQDKLMCSYDGDADRIVFHTFGESSWSLLDGDKIAALVSTFLIGEIRAAGLFDPNLRPTSREFRMGVVQTAYANGASTAFLKSQGIEIAIAKTGVKFLHHVALDYDVGVYFEANGHGTVIFSKEFLDVVNNFTPTIIESSWSDELIQSHTRRNLAFSRLQSSFLLINQAVGDAISDMLLAMVSLQILGWSFHDWIAMYSDLSSRQTKVPATNKSLIICSEDETRVIQPPALQHDLDEAMKSIPSGRCFVRPSGTEDYVRIYAEAETQADADRLALLCIGAIQTHIGITGDLPTTFVN